MGQQLIGGGIIYPQVVRYIPYRIPFARYAIKSPFGDFCSNVHKRFIHLWGEDMAVRMTAWGELRESNPQLNRLNALVRHEYRLAFIKSVEFEKMFD